MERVVSWKALIELIEPHYPKSGRVGRPPIGVERMLRMYFLQQWYSLSDEGRDRPHARSNRSNSQLNRRDSKMNRRNFAMNRRIILMHRFNSGSHRPWLESILQDSMVNQFNSELNGRIILMRRLYLELN